MAIEVFGAGAVQSAYVSYVPLNIAANSITLLWPTSYVNAPYIDPITQIHYDVLAASMEVNTAAVNAHTVTLPNATQSSVGSNFIITNVGVSAFNLLRSDSSVLQIIDTIPLSNSYWVQLTDNSTPAGVWAVVTFGAGTSTASANALAGNGLAAIGVKLNTNTPIVKTGIIPVIDDTFRAKLILWTGGAVTIPLPAIGDVLPGYYVSFNNEGTARIIIAPGELVTTIDRQLSIEVGVQQSLTIISDGTNWWTLGFGQNQFAVTSSLNRNVAGNADINLTNVEASSLIQNYDGFLTGNITVFFPITTNYWFINNITTGATLSVQLIGGVGTSYVIPQGSKQIFYSNGFSLFPIPTGLMLADGTVSRPAAAFLSNPGTGIHTNGAGTTLEFSVDGVRVGHFNNANPASLLHIPSFDQSQTLSLRVSDTHTRFTYNNIDAISITTAGVTTLSSPLPIASGGTAAITQSGAATNILPAAVDGDIIYWDSVTNAWTLLPIDAGVAGNTLTLVDVGAGRLLPRWA